jgi:ribosome-associated toxin RatA of RatAB toxin-antitoxin module
VRTVRLKVRVSTEDTNAAFGAIADFTRFPALAADVRSVETRAAPAVTRHSDWEVNFRRGAMRWTEWETVDPAALRIEFGQTDGDFADFTGSWQLTPVRGGAEVLFTVTYDFGIESLAGLMDPIAERVVKRVICSVLAGLFGDIAVLEGGEALTDLAHVGR